MDQTLFRKPAFARFLYIQQQIVNLIYRFEYNDVLLNVNFKVNIGSGNGLASGKKFFIT